MKFRITQGKLELKLFYCNDSTSFVHHNIIVLIHLIQSQNLIKASLFPNKQTELYWIKVFKG